jgi:hypothetical protein
MRLLRLTIFALACSAAGTTGAWGASRDIETSWGKAGVSLIQYRLDGGVCAARAITLDISGTPAAQRMVLASRAIDNAYASAWMYYPSASDGPVLGNPWRAVYQARVNFRVDDNFEEIRGIQYDALRECLLARGYREFRLTDDQRARLKKLPLGSERRRDFLHSLGSDGEILARQAI